ncbi:MAG: hypothetical protein JSW00_05900, partial [Thermoplasmata archaeon]
YDVKVKAADFADNSVEKKAHYEGTFEKVAKFLASMLEWLADTMAAVGRAILNALALLVDWIWDMIKEMINIVIAPIVEAISDYVNGVATAAGKAWDEFIDTGSVSSNNARNLLNALFPPIVRAIIILISIVSVAYTIGSLIAGAGTIMSFVLTIFLTAMATVMTFTPVGGIAGKAVVDLIYWLFDTNGYTLTDFTSLMISGILILLSGHSYLQRLTTKAKTDNTKMALLFSIIGIILTYAISKSFDPDTDMGLAWMGLFISIVGIIYAIAGFLDYEEVLKKGASSGQMLIMLLGLVIGGISSYMFIQTMIDAQLLKNKEKD